MKWNGAESYMGCNVKSVVFVAIMVFAFSSHVFASESNSWTREKSDFLERGGFKPLLSDYERQIRMIRDKCSPGDLLVNTERGGNVFWNWEEKRTVMSVTCENKLYFFSFRADSGVYTVIWANQKERDGQECWSENGVSCLDRFYEFLREDTAATYAAWIQYRRQLAANEARAQRREACIERCKAEVRISPLKVDNCNMKCNLDGW